MAKTYAIAPKTAACAVLFASTANLTSAGTFIQHKIHEKT